MRKSRFPVNKAKPARRPIRLKTKRSADPMEMEMPEEELKPKAKHAAVFKQFEMVWSQLFLSPIHLDSAISKLPSSIKSILAQIVPLILLKPSSLAEAVGVGIPSHEPWSLDAKNLARWRPARLVAERIYQMMSQGLPGVGALPEDFPPNMIAEWEKSWGKTTTVELMDALSKEAPLSLRANKRLGPSALLAALTEGRQLPVQAKRSNLSPLGVRLSGYAPVLGTDCYKQGGFEIQDEGSQFMALFSLWPEKFGHLLSSRPGKVKTFLPSTFTLPKDAPAKTVIDTCAGAGGKSLAMADALGGKGRVYSYDTSPKKLLALRRRMVRAGLNNIQAVPLVEGKESDTVERFKETAQVVLVDAPCSGWGVLRRNPDIKWRQSADVLARMPEIQFRLLSLYSGLVAPGGRLIYGVCTFREAETREIVSRFLKEHPQFSATEGGYLGPDPCDGFFMQCFVKKEK